MAINPETGKYEGLLLIDKAEGLSSYDVIRQLKKVLPHKQKIGHTGTLDPFATGLLIIMLGRATKLNDEIHKLPKVYETLIEFGYETDTQDPSGEVINKTDDDSPISQVKIEEAMADLTGYISQIPPNYSAKKVNGQRAYKLARQNVDFEIKPKNVTVHDYMVTEYDWPKVRAVAEVSTGTYIRTLVVDLAHKLNTHATAVELCRTSIGGFNLSDAVKSDDIESTDFDKIILPAEIRS